MSPAAATWLYVLIGKPVAGNPTEEMLEAAFAAAGLDARYVSLEVEPDALGRGFVESLRTVVDPRGISAVVLGAGGAARAIVAELSLAGAARIAVVNRTLARVEEVCADGRCEAAPLTDSWVVPADADVVVQATTVGMDDEDARLPLVWPEGGGVAADVVISPPRTAFLRDAEAAGRATLDGLGMLVAQAAVGFRWWTGLEADADAMRAALVRELAIA